MNAHTQRIVGGARKIHPPINVSGESHLPVRVGDADSDFLPVPRTHEAYLATSAVYTPMLVSRERYNIGELAVKSQPYRS